MTPVDDGRRDFDFLHGNWEVRNLRLARRLQDSEDWQEFEAFATVRPILHGLGNVDTISAENIPGIGAFEGLTLRLFDPAQDSWTIFWASTGSPGHLDPPLTGRFSNGRGVFDGEDLLDGRLIHVRFEWTSDGADHARWQQAFSGDAGQTWEINWVMEFTRAPD
jgi:hypothetical protein